MNQQLSTTQWLIAKKTAANGKTIYVLQSWPAYFSATKNGEKRHEIRNYKAANIQFNVGDYLALFEYDPTTKTYSGDMIACEITYISPNTGEQFWLNPDYAYMSIKKLEITLDLKNKLFTNL